jgi:L-asparagine transporter-like permease
MGPLEYSKALPAILKHLRHKGQPLQLAAIVQSLQDLVLAFDLNPFTGTKFWAIIHDISSLTCLESHWVIVILSLHPFTTIGHSNSVVKSSLFGIYLIFNEPAAVSSK